MNKRDHESLLQAKNNQFWASEYKKIAPEIKKDIQLALDFPLPEKHQVDDVNLLEDSEEDIVPLVPKQDKNNSVVIHSDLLSFVYELEDVYYNKMIEYAKWNEIVSLNNSDMNICFEEACKEYSSLHADKKNHDHLFKVTREHIWL